MSEEQLKFWTEVKSALILEYHYRRADADFEIERFQKWLKSASRDSLLHRFDKNQVAEMLGRWNLNHVKFYHESDNVLVGRKRYKEGKDAWYSNDFFRVVFREFDPSWPEDDRSVALGRYTVPGRIDSYDFALSSNGRRIVFSSETDTKMVKGLSMVQADLDRLKVIKMLVAFCEKPGHLKYTRELVNHLLPSIAPKSKAYRTLKRLLPKLQVRWNEELKRRREEKERKIESKIEEWHNGAGDGQDLHEYLGWSKQEYDNWVMQRERDRNVVVTDMIVGDKSQGAVK